MDLVQVIYGPYAGQRLTMAKADAEAAIADGWAIDPFKPAGEPKQLSDDERAKIVEKAEHAARHLRGEADEKPDRGGDDEPKESKPKRR